MRLPLVLFALSMFGGVVQARPTDVCIHIERAISKHSDVYYPGDANYTRDVSHYSVGSALPALCSVEPGSAQDVGTVLKIIGSSRTPFAVKSGGHSPNPGFSGSTGVQIAMYRFSEVGYDPVVGSVTVGTGLIWDEVYAALEADPASSGVSVVGGRIPGVGVGGFALGGGYSWLTNQHGLTVDNILALELVKPDGTVHDITQTSDPDLFFALKGGQNNFGIVTRITLKAIAQGQVWGGLMSFSAEHLNEFSAATERFSRENTDPKAQLIATYIYANGEMFFGLSVFYDAPVLPTPSAFDDFINIPTMQSDLATRSLGQLVASLELPPLLNQRAIFEDIPVFQYTPAVIDAIVNETLFWSQYFVDQGHPDVQIAYNVEPFLPSAFAQNTHPTAYPPSRPEALPTNLQYVWTSEELDEVIVDAMKQNRERIVSVAIAEGQADLVDAALYPNYALFDTPLEKMFGSNVPRLRAIKREVDPQDVMGLTGGFKF